MAQPQPIFVTARFHPGTIVATPAALAALQDSGENAVHFVARHLRGDYGTVAAGDRAATDHAVQSGGCILSANTLQRGAWGVLRAVIAVR